MATDEWRKAKGSCAAAPNCRDTSYCNLFFARERFGIANRTLDPSDWLSRTRKLEVEPHVLEGLLLTLCLSHNVPFHPMMHVYEILQGQA
jgi:hypothetical protein